MSGHEARINDALKQLGEEFRLGMVAADEYRSRRRMLIASWDEIEVTTSPGSLRSVGVAPAAAPAAQPAARIAASPPPKKANPFVFVAIGAGVLILAGAGWVLSHRAQPSTPNSMRSAVPAVAPASAAVEAIKKAADEFLARNNWDADAVDAFAAQWRALSAEDQARALEEPSLRTLRHELSQNLKAESELVTADTPPEQRRRLEALTRFAQELGGA